jgi:hypothetical protein
MKLALFRRRIQPENVRVPHEAPAPTYTRRPVQRCAGCNIWTASLVYMRNGGHYCVPCAKRLRDVMGTALAGKRADDIRTLES